MNHFSVVILAAGRGTRMKSAMPKPLHRLAHKLMLGYVIDAYRKAGAKEIVVVISPDDTITPNLFPNVKMIIQQEQKGTGHAALIGLSGIEKPVDKIIMALGDMPFIQPETIVKLAKCDNAVTVLAMRPDDPAKYGRLIVENNILEKIVEYKDANDRERTVNLCNSGTIALNGAQAKSLLEAITPQNAAGEFYATDVVGIARNRGEKCSVVEAPIEETAAANTREELSYLENIVQTELRRKHMLNGVTLMEPDSVYFAHDTEIGQDTLIEPNVFFGEGVIVENNVHIKAFSHIEGAKIGAGVSVGPFARIRPETEIKNDAHIGNFVEIKKSVIGEGTKIGHLTYIGDAEIGKKTNIGAGTITSNYDGFEKFKTEIGDNTFIGANSIIIAPVTIGANAMTAAGSVITKDVAPEALALGRAQQVEKPNWAKEFRIKKQASKEQK